MSTHHFHRRAFLRGIGVTMITQRPAVLNKNALTQAETLIALQMQLYGQHSPTLVKHVSAQNASMLMSALPMNLLPKF